MRTLIPIVAASSLCVLVAGCPGTDSKKGEGGGAASVTVVGGGPIEGLAVVFQRSDGTVIAQAQTDASGKASASIESGTLVTVGRYFSLPSPRWELTTVVGVNPGEDLVLGQAAAGSSAGTAAIGFTGPVSSATEYRVDLGCAAKVAFGVGSPVSVPFYTTCGASIDALTLARSAGGTPLAWSSAVDLPITGSAPSQTAAGTSAAWRTDFGTLAVTLENPPATAAAATATLTPRRNGLRFSSAATSMMAALAPPAGVVLDVPFVQDFGTSARTEVRVTYASSTDEARVIVNQSDFAARTLDLATVLPPRVSGAGLVEASGAWTGSWTLDGSDAALDATTLSASWTDANGRHDWRVVLSPSATEFAFPTMPSALAAYPPASGTLPSWFQVTVDDLSEATGYDAFRSGHLGLIFAVPEAGAWTLRRSGTVAF